LEDTIPDDINFSLHWLLNIFLFLREFFFIKMQKSKKFDFDGTVRAGITVRLKNGKRFIDAIFANIETAQNAQVGRH
jgi:hypothetical protein